MTDAEPILGVEDVAKRSAALRAVDGATFDVAPHSITALIGPNGAGKSTLFNVVTGFDRADRGDVRFAGRSIFGRPRVRDRTQRLVRTFQLTKTLSVMSVLDNMLLASVGNPGESLTGAVFRPYAWLRHERRSRTRALELLETFGLHEKRADYAGTLSGGQRKLLELARALMLEPRARSARRAARRRQSDARPAPALAHRATAGRAGHDVPVRRARHGGRDAPRRSRRRDGAGARDRRRHARRGPQGRARDRGLPRLRCRQDPTLGAPLAEATDA